MKRVFIFLQVGLILMSFTMGLSEAAKKTSVYSEFSGEGDENVIVETNVEYKDIDDGQKAIHREKQTGTCLMQDEFITDQDGSLIKWTRFCKEDDTDLITERKGDMLTIRGKLRGEVMDNDLNLGNKHLHIYPKYSLTKFVLSDLKSMKIWTLRRDKMSKLPMVVTKKGEEEIEIDGKKVETIKVFYTIDDKLKSRFFSHTYYFRKSDGLFLKKIENNGKVEILTKGK